MGGVGSEGDIRGVVVRVIREGWVVRVVRVVRTCTTSTDITRLLPFLVIPTGVQVFFLSTAVLNVAAHWESARRLLNRKMCATNLLFSKDTQLEGQEESTTEIE